MSVTSSCHDLFTRQISEKCGLCLENAFQWKEDMKEEINSLIENRTWNLQALPSNHKAVGCKWVYRVKCKPDGTIDRYKARLCAKGYSQKEGIDFNETFSPVVRYCSSAYRIGSR